ncbi:MULTISPECIES: hypothetical protein [Pseudomonadaceae]|uniref:hypothetical protein n=1 Tax=Pseudomonadaceae TaxID=135621 RepID=UPI0015E2F150|nr:MULTISPECIES: hypothetical protein [Pseudomonadaceae]MBA1276172.1 hypothetical protein [Stutzerimonas stutzeri]MBC8648682.1 hypothetical protein [Pseudomonas sp. MT4]QXY92665.1 hypothetical protein GYM54_14245 [Pseudomonas sp. MTM4]
MAKKVRTEAELGAALKNNEDSIEIEGDLANKALKIRATGKAAWIVAIGAIGVATYSAFATLGTGGASAPVTATTAGFTAVAATTILGATVTYSAIATAIAAGGVGALNSLRKYKQISYENNRLVLRRK